MSNPVAPFAVLSGEGTPLEIPFGGSVTTKAHTRNTNGSLTVLEFVHPPKAGPALHTHLREDEVWYVLEGEYRLKAGDGMFRLSAGAWPSVHAARRTASRTSATPQAGCW
jgi:quercetin dioxygenase-like cupin family protein